MCLLPVIIFYILTIRKIGPRPRRLERRCRCHICLLRSHDLFGLDLCYLCYKIPLHQTLENEYLLQVNFVSITQCPFPMGNKMIRHSTTMKRPPLTGETHRPTSHRNPDLSRNNLINNNTCLCSC